MHIFAIFKFPDMLHNVYQTSLISFKAW